jgi:hypothetical protein
MDLFELDRAAMNAAIEGNMCSIDALRRRRRFEANERKRTGLPLLTVRNVSERLSCAAGAETRQEPAVRRRRLGGPGTTPLWGRYSVRLKEVMRHRVFSTPSERKETDQE